MRNQLREVFQSVYRVAEMESARRNLPLSPESIKLLRILAAKYRAGLHPHLELIAKYIGQGLVNTEVQLEGTYDEARTIIFLWDLTLKTFIEIQILFQLP